MGAPILGEFYDLRIRLTDLDRLFDIVVQTLTCPYDTAAVSCANASELANSLGIAGGASRSEAMLQPVPGQICSVGVGQAGNGLRSVEFERSSSQGRQVLRAENRAVIGEADEACVECGIPECGEE